MSFVLSKLAWLIVRPSTLVLLIGLVGLVLAWGRRRRTGMVLLTLSLGCYTAVLVLPVDQWVMMPLEDRFPAVTAPPPADGVAGILVLGGAVEPALSAEHGMPALDDAAERMTTLVALARRYPQAKLAFTGGNGLLVHGAMTEAVVARQLFDSLGLEDRGVIYEDRSRNTWENAVFTKALVQPKPGERWILITSAAHMPRSVGIFRKTGWDVLPWPVGYKTGRSLTVQYNDALGLRLSRIDWSVHEWIGLVAYWLMGRTSAVFPAPDAKG